MTFALIESVGWATNIRPDGAVYAVAKLWTVKPARLTARPDEIQDFWMQLPPADATEREPLKVGELYSRVDGGFWTEAEYIAEIIAYHRTGRANPRSELQYVVSEVNHARLLYNFVLRYVTEYRNGLRGGDLRDRGLIISDAHPILERPGVRALVGVEIEVTAGRVKA